ncbi:MAG: pseudouridine synthase [Gemmatimonadales bacterium]|jgi:23S rRNA pseudouridine2605 synthase
MAIRLARFLARAGVTSRRGAADLVRTGRVRVNGHPPIGPGDPIDPGADQVTVDGRILALPGTVWLALHKPPGYVTSRTATPRYPSVFVLVEDASPGLVAVGRLDVLSEGLLLFTTDGDAANRLMHPRWQVDRTYRVEVSGRPPVDAAAILAHGVALEDGEPPVRPVAWRFEAGKSGGVLEVTLREGRTRIVRRMAAVLGLGVRWLKRVAYGPVRLGELAPGRARALTERELAALYGAIGLPAPEGLSRSGRGPAAPAASRRPSPRPRSHQRGGR